MLDLKNLTIKKTQEMIKNREVSVREITTAYQDNIKKKNGEINAYLEAFDGAFKEAEDQDERFLGGECLKPLSGITFAIKDNMLIKGQTCSSASKILENYTAPYDATVVRKLRRAGAIFLGRANMDEFAMGSSTESSAFGPTKNPHDLERVPGGSSGGSAAAVAMDGALAALGSDTGGSVRQPASFCGVVGLKPTYGAVSRHGLMAMASSLDQIGPLAKTVEDAEIIFNAIKGRDEFDSTSANAPHFHPAPGEKLKVGVLKYDRSGVDEDVNNALDEAAARLRGAGHEIKEIDLPGLQYSLACYYIIMPAEVSANLARFDGVRYGLSKKGKNLLDDYMETRASGFGKEAKKRIMLGTYVLSSGYYDAYYGRAGRVRELIRREFDAAFDLAAGGVNAFILPTAPTPAFKLGEKTEDPIQMYLSDVFTVSANIAGIPAISVPAGKSKTGLPIGIQIAAPRFREDILFNLGKETEKYD